MSRAVGDLVSIGRLSATLHGLDRQRMDRVLGLVAGSGLDSALAVAGLPGGEWCVRRIDVPVLVDAEAGDERIAAEWSAAVAGAVREALAVGDDVIRYPSVRAAAVELVGDVAVGRWGREWAWRQLELLGPGVTGAGAAIVGALGRVAEDALGVLVMAVEAVGVRALDRVLGPDGWALVGSLVTGIRGEAFAGVLAAGGDAGRGLSREAGRGLSGDAGRGLSGEADRSGNAYLFLGASPLLRDSSYLLRDPSAGLLGGSPGDVSSLAGAGGAPRPARGHGSLTDSDRGSKVRVANEMIQRGADLLRRSRFAAAVARAGVSADSRTAAAWAAIVAVEADPAVLRRPERDEVVAGVAFALVAGSGSGSGEWLAAGREVGRDSVDPERLVAGGRLYDEKSGMEDGSSRDPSGRSPAAVDLPAIRVDRELATDPGPAPDSPVIEEAAGKVPQAAAQGDSTVEGAVRTGEAAFEFVSLPDGRIGAQTAWGGLLFLLNTAAEAGVPAAAFRPTLEGRSIRWILHALATRLLPIAPNDPAALALCGLTPQHHPPSTIGDPPTPRERQALNRLARRWRKTTATKLTAAIATSAPASASAPAPAPASAAPVSSAATSSASAFVPATAPATSTSAGTSGSVAVPAPSAPGAPGRDAFAARASAASGGAAAESFADRDLGAVVTELAHRPAVIVADPGWIEVHLPLAGVDLEVRRAGLDFDPGWIPWLRTVVRFVYLGGDDD